MVTMNNPDYKVCKSKDCQKVLPEDYKYKYCEACRNRRVDNIKKVGKAVGGGLATLSTVALAAVRLVPDILKKE